MPLTGSYELQLSAGSPASLDTSHWQLVNRLRQKPLPWRAPAARARTLHSSMAFWVAEPVCVVPVAIALRESLISLSAARQAGEGQQMKMEMIYDYLTGRVSGTASKRSWKNSPICRRISKKSGRL